MPDTSPPCGWGGMINLKIKGRGGVRHTPHPVFGPGAAVVCRSVGRMRAMIFHPVIGFTIML